MTGVKKKLARLAAGSECGIVGEWTKNIINHLYWCAASVTNNDDAPDDASDDDDDNENNIAILAIFYVLHLEYYGYCKGGPLEISNASLCFCRYFCKIIWLAI